MYQGTLYQICGYLEPTYGTDSASAGTTGSTTALQAASKFEITVTGSSQATIGELAVCNMVAERCGVNPARILLCAEAYTAPVTGGRRLQDHVSVFSGIVEVDRKTGTPKPSDLTALDSTQEAALAADLAAQLGSNFNPATYVATGDYAPSPITVSWATAPSVSDKTSSTVTIGLKSDNNNGQIACVVLNDKTQAEYGSNNSYKPSGE